METRCKCGGQCVKPALDILKDIACLYDPCPDCKSWEFKKFTPLKDQINLKEINEKFGKCTCGKRHLDITIAQVLKIMIEEDITDKNSSLRNTCAPLITPAYPLNSVPYLLRDSLVILSDKMSKKCAERIVNEVPEVKGVLKGNMRETVGIKDVDHDPHIYQLLAGCDMRCDIVQTPFGAICIHKYQSKIHIEIPKLTSPKIDALKKILSKYNKPTVLDSTCGPGTLGIACLKSGAERVVFNDIWYPAAELTAINLEANGFPVEFLGDKKGLVASGDNFEVYCMDIRELKFILDEKFDICIVDTFPDVDSKEFVDAAKKLSKEVLLI